MATRTKPWTAADVKAVRERAGMDRAKFGALFGRSGRTVEKWEQGTAPIPTFVPTILNAKGLRRPAGDR